LRAGWGEWWGAWGLSLSSFSSWVCRDVLQNFLKVLYDADEPVKGKAHCILLSIIVTFSFVGSEK